MVQSVELLLDTGLDATVRDQWQALADADLPSLAAHTAPSNRPHVTVLAAAEVPPDVEAALPEAITGLPVEVRLGGLVLFGTRGHRVLARLVVPSPALLELHSRVLEVADACPGLSATSRVGAWTPHVTLARRIPVADLPRALDALAAAGRQDAPDVGAATTIRRWDGHAKREWPVTTHSPT